METATELHAAHLPRSADALALLVDRLPVSIAVLRGPLMIYELANRAYCRLVGHHGIVGPLGGHPSLDQRNEFRLVLGPQRTGLETRIVLQVG